MENTTKTYNCPLCTCRFEGPDAAAGLSAHLARVHHGSRVANAANQFGAWFTNTHGGGAGVFCFCGLVFGSNTSWVSPPTVSWDVPTVGRLTHDFIDHFLAHAREGPCRHLFEQVRAQAMLERIGRGGEGRTVVGVDDKGNVRYADEFISRTNFSVTSS